MGEVSEQPSPNEVNPEGVISSLSGQIAEYARRQAILEALLSQKDETIKSLSDALGTKQNNVKEAKK